MESIGKVININFGKLYEWRLTAGNNCREILNYDNEVKNFLHTELDIDYFNNSNKGITASFNKPYWEKDEEKIEAQRIESIQNKIKELKGIFNYSIKYNNPLQIYYICDAFNIIGWADNKIIIPKEFIAIELYPNYDDVLPSEIPLLIGQENVVNSSLIKGGNNSKKQLIQKIEDTKKQLIEKDEELKNELEILKQELRKKEEELRLQMEEKMQLLKEKKAEFEKELFGLEHQLYNLRCLLGDSIELTHLRKGKECPKEQPVVLYQKLKFLDEDLAKLKTLYCHDYDDEAYVEDIFANDDVVMEMFCPTDKCVSLFRISKDNKYYCKGDGNVLERLMYTNGTRIGILVRNGENLYLIWTEDSKIYLKENFLYNPNTQTNAYEEENIDKNEVITDNDYMNKRNLAWVQFFSRQFLFNILQGLIEYKKILSFPEKVSVFAQSPYIIFSTADNQIADNRFGTLSEFMKSRNKLTRIGDYVLPIMSIRGSYTEKSMWGNAWVENHERGRGYKNRVQDCEIKDEVQKINLIEIPSKVEYLYKNFTKWVNSKEVEIPDEDLDGEKLSRKEEYKKIISLMQNDSGIVIKDRIKIDNVVYTARYRNAGKGYVWKSTNTQYEFTGIKKETFFYDDLNEYKYYISVEKPESWNSNRKEDSNVRSNIQIYRDEFINLTYLSSTILRYFMSTKKIGGYFGTNFAYAIKYLHKALKFIENREKKEYQLINNYYTKGDASTIDKIDLILIDYKYQNKIKELTDRKAKKFAEYLELIEDYKKKAIEIENNIDWKI